MKMIAAALVIGMTGSAFAADLASKKEPAPAPSLPSPWDFEVGAGLTSDYIFRGITQSNHRPSVAAHGELRYNFNENWQAYAGVSGESIKLNPYVAGPAMELDGYGGLRATYGAFGLDAGAIIYGYPNTPVPTFAPRTITWFELYAKPTYTVNDWLTVGGNFFYTPSYLNTGAPGEYLSATAKVTLPYNFALSGEIGHQWLGRTGLNWAGYLASNVGYEPFKLPGYTYWNVGASYTFKFATLDVRYHGTNLSRSSAAQLTGIYNNGVTPFGQAHSTYGRAAFVATLSFALTSKDLK
ncbi:MAG: TorF family putative porin [Hyphomicrobiales bacterium]|nr:TorF family putative porin [Hyphomicrobiales bacterium]